MPLCLGQKHCISMHGKPKSRHTLLYLEICMSTRFHSRGHVFMAELSGELEVHLAVLSFEERRSSPAAVAPEVISWSHCRYGSRDTYLRVVDVHSGCTNGPKAAERVQLQSDGLRLFPEEHPMLTSLCNSIPRRRRRCRKFVVPAVYEG